MMSMWSASRAAVFTIGLASIIPAALALAEDPPAFQQAVSVTMEVATEGFTPQELAQISAQLSDWLEQDRPTGVIESAVEVQLTPEQINAIEFPEHTDSEPLKVGMVVPMANPVQVRGLTSPAGGMQQTAARLGGGIVTRTPDGGLVWAVAIVSDKAGAVRVHVEDVSLPEDVELYFYSRSGEAYGPYTGTGPDGTGEFWTPSVFGKEGILQLQTSGPIDEAELWQVSLRVTEVGHIAHGVFGAAPQGQRNAASFCPVNASCIVNTNCQNQPIVNGAELAVAKMLWISGAFIYTCSGGLIADTVASSQIPYFLTANHCLNKNSNNLEAFFQYQAPCGSTANCTGTWDDPPPGSFAGKTVGAIMKVTGKKGDFTLLQLSQNPPAGSVFLGWTNTPVAFNSGVPLYRVSHPSGAPQAYSDATVNTAAQTCIGWPRGERIYSTGVVGGTEGGSSGSPVLNASGQIVGQLSGACGTNVNNVCDNANNRTVDGAFAYYYDKVQPFLAP